MFEKMLSAWRIFGTTSDSVAIVITLLVLMVALMVAERKTGLKTLRFVTISVYAVVQTIAVLAFHAEYGAILAVQTSVVAWWGLLIGMRRGIRGSTFVTGYAFLACYATIILAVHSTSPNLFNYYW